MITGANAQLAVIVIAVLAAASSRSRIVGGLPARRDGLAGGVRLAVLRVRVKGSGQLALGVVAHVVLATRERRRSWVVQLGVGFAVGQQLALAAKETAFAFQRKGLGGR